MRRWRGRRRRSRRFGKFELDGSFGAADRRRVSSDEFKVVLGVVGQRNRERDGLPVVAKRNSPRLRRARIKRVFKVVRAANRNFYFGVALAADPIVRDCDRANGRRGAIDGNLNGRVGSVGVDSGSDMQRT